MVVKNIKTIIISENTIIGYKNNLPWNFKSDLSYFKTITIGNDPFNKSIVIMGRNTYESLPNNKLKDRINICVSSTLKTDNVLVVTSFQEALNLAYNKNSKHSENIWVIGGKTLYQEAIRHKDLNKIYYRHTCMKT